MAILRHVLIVWLLVSGSVWADYPARAVTEPPANLVSQCSSSAASQNPPRQGRLASCTEGDKCGWTGPNGWVCWVLIAPPSGWTDGYLYPAQLGCPDGGQLQGNTCVQTCQAGEAAPFDIFAGYSVGPNKVISGASINPWSNPTSRCSDGCEINITSIGTCPGQVGTVDNPKPITCHGTGVRTGNTCTVTPENSLTTPTTVPTVPNHPPKCLPGEGVLTSSSGTVACVPEGVPSSVPIVDTVKTTTTYPDGSSKTTETTYTKDPATGIQDTRQTTTTTGAGGGSGAGQAGPVGTTTGTGSATGNGAGGGGADGGQASDLCKNNPGLQICKGGMNEEATQKAIKEILSPTEQPNKSAIDQAKAEEQQKQDAHKQLFEDWGNKGQSDSNGWFAWAMIPEVPSGTCQPFTGTVAGRQVSLDWCDQLEKIRQIAGYTFYILTAFALFAIFAGAFSRGGNK